MTKPTPRHEDEWYFSGATSESAAENLEWRIQSLTRKITKLQVELANAHLSLKAIRADEWAKEDNGLLTLSEDNPLRF